MSFPISITFRGIQPCASIEAHIRKTARQLDGWKGDILQCRVAVESPNTPHSQGNRCHVRISIAVPGDAIFGMRSADIDPHSQDLCSAIDRAFGDTRRSLSEFSRRRQTVPRGPAASEERISA